MICTLLLKNTLLRSRFVITIADANSTGLDALEMKVCERYDNRKSVQEIPLNQRALRHSLESEKGMISSINQKKILLTKDLNLDTETSVLRTGSFEAKLRERYAYLVGPTGVWFTRVLVCRVECVIQDTIKLLTIRDASRSETGKGPFPTLVSFTTGGRILAVISSALVLFGSC